MGIPGLLIFNLAISVFTLGRSYFQEQRKHYYEKHDWFETMEPNRASTAPPIAPLIEQTFCFPDKI